MRNASDWRDRAPIKYFRHPLPPPTPLYYSRTPRFTHLRDDSDGERVGCWDDANFSGQSLFAYRSFYDVLYALEEGGPDPRYKYALHERGKIRVALLDAKMAWF